MLVKSVILLAESSLSSYVKSKTVRKVRKRLKTGIKVRVGKEQKEPLFITFRQF